MNTIRSEQRVPNTTAGSQVPSAMTDLLRPEDAGPDTVRGPRSDEQSTLGTIPSPKVLCRDTKTPAFPLNLEWEGVEPLQKDHPPESPTSPAPIPARGSPRSNLGM